MKMHDNRTLKKLEIIRRKPLNENKKAIAASSKDITVFLRQIKAPHKRYEFKLNRWNNLWMRMRILMFQKQSIGCVLCYVVKNFAKFTGKCLCRSLIFNEVSGLQSWTKHIETSSRSWVFIHVTYTFKVNLHSVIA